jgi:hypothetical protein
MKKILLAILVFVLFVPSVQANDLPDQPVARTPKVWYVLAGVAIAASGADAVTTVQMKAHLGTEFRELDPLAKPFVNLPKPAYYASDLAFSGAVSLAGLKMAHSANPVIRKLWWAPQVAQTGFNSWMAIRNSHTDQKEQPGIWHPKPKR